MSDDRIRPHIRALIERGNVTLAERHELRCNSWEWHALIPAYTTEALLEMARHTIDNCYPDRRAICYGDALAMFVAPELVKRIEQLTRENVDLRNQVNRASRDLSEAVWGPRD